MLPLQISYRTQSVCMHILNTLYRSDSYIKLDTSLFTDDEGDNSDDPGCLA